MRWRSRENGRWRENMDTKDLLNKIMENVDSIGHISAADIPNIDLYMDQVTTFMDKSLRRGSRYPDADKVMTKTMIEITIETIRIKKWKRH